MATLKDVAEKAGVTVTTVSRVINNRGYIGEQTRQKVQEAMKELHYQPNELARSLSMKRTNTIGIIVPHIVHPYFAKLISELESEAAAHKYKILLCNTKAETKKELEYIDMCKSNRVSGIVLCSRNVDIKKMKNLDIPVITIERYLDAGTVGIECDNYQGGRMATEHLIEAGCRNLIHLSGIKNENMPADARAEGFRDVCKEHGIQHREMLSNNKIYSTMDYHEYIRQAIREVPDVDGIFASSDLIAAQTIQVCNELNLKIPDQIKIVGFDDVDIAKYTTPMITTIHQPVHEMASWAIEFIEKSLRKEVIPEQLKLPVSLVKRQTT
ncbi:MAG: LacI family DNA-binding transcriptional regulator [Lachnospiraceae bacterium]|nr:LacI family DNA-binding transcriptional regulator [Lachnospiraceae bacterium]